MAAAAQQMMFENAARIAEVVIPEIRCQTKVRKVKCKYTWKIDDYKSACAKKGVVLKSIPFSASYDTCNWILELHAKDDDYNYLGLFLKAKDIDEVIRYGPISGDLKFSLINSEGQESNSKTEDFSINATKTYFSFEYFMKNDDILRDEAKLLPENTLTVYCEVGFIKYENKLEFPGHRFPIQDKAKNCNPLGEFEKLYIKDEYSDISIIINGKKYPAHRTILAARSPVFAAMLKHHTMESNSNSVEVKDIDEQIFLEALRYMYTGKVQDLEVLAFELLPVADKYDLRELKTMCEEVLYTRMTTETVVKILILADMHNELSLKNKALWFIRAFSVDVVNLMDSEGWSDLTTRPHLMKELLQMYMKR